MKRPTQRAEVLRHQEPGGSPQGDKLARIEELLHHEVFNLRMLMFQLNVH